MDWIFESIKDAYIYCFYTAKDPRAHTWLFTESPPLPFIILLSSYYFLIRMGPTIMKNRKPYDLQHAMIFYNAFQVISNASAVSAAIYLLFFKSEFDFVCQPIDRTNDVEYVFTYIYFAFKVVDLLDTVFIVLRKHNKQLSFLHCYHHFMMCSAIYLGIMWLPGGMSVLLGIVNSFVHVFMYSYYFLTAFKPELKQSAFFKRNITHLQILQFLVLSFFYTRSLFASNCEFPRSLSFLLLSQNAYMLYLFSRFYVKTYLKKETK